MHSARCPQPVSIFNVLLLPKQGDMVDIIHGNAAVNTGLSLRAGYGLAITLQSKSIVVLVANGGKKYTLRLPPGVYLILSPEPTEETTYFNPAGDDATAWIIDMNTLKEAGYSS